MRAPLVGLLIAGVASAAAIHYEVTLIADPAGKVLRGREAITIPPGSPARVLRRGAGMTIERGAPMEVTASRSTQRLEFEYIASAGQGFRWLEGDAGLFTAFHCEAWMVCDNDPGYRATLRLEVIVPVAAGWTVAGPGVLRKRWTRGPRQHFLFEQREPVQSYLFSFGAAKLSRSTGGDFAVYAADPDQSAVFARTRDAWAFLRRKAAVDPIQRPYAQVFLPNANLGQEAAGAALMGEPYRQRLAREDDVALMAHEAAHQWWGVLVGIASWSDFWLNEGFAEFMTAAYIEEHHGRAAYDAMLTKLRADLVKLRRDGKDRPLHWTKWTSATEALGPLPYVKGAVFLDLLRSELGDDLFWRGLAVYTSKHARQLVTSTEFQKSMEHTAGRSLASLFGQWVW